jgi:exopolyphosphatase/pppGpp-phosphohydrolase
MSDNGGPAFPYEHGHSPDAANVRECGMTLRDYFAAKAAAGFIAMCADPGVHEPKPEAVAEFAYRVADAMLAARKK